MFRRLLLAVCCAAAVPAFAQQHSHDHAEAAAQAPLQGPLIEQVWSRAMPPTSPTGAVYFTLSNPTDQADRLIGAATERADKAELHEHAHENGLMRMRHVEAIELPAHGRIDFVPGGYHVMLFGLKQPLVAGDRFAVTLQFEHAGAVQTEVQVLDQPPATGHGHMHH